MIEVHITQGALAWEVNATILPQGGLGIAQDAKLGTIASPSFAEASKAIAMLSALSFHSNADRWPVPEPKFQIINQMSHSDPTRFGNYIVKYRDKVVGTIKDFPRTEMLRLIKEALVIVSRDAGE